MRIPRLVEWKIASFSSLSPFLFVKLFAFFSNRQWLAVERAMSNLMTFHHQQTMRWLRKVFFIILLFEQLLFGIMRRREKKARRDSWRLLNHIQFFRRRCRFFGATHNKTEKCVEHRFIWLMTATSNWLKILSSLQHFFLIYTRRDREKFSAGENHFSYEQNKSESVLFPRPRALGRPL